VKHERGTQGWPKVNGQGLYMTGWVVGGYAVLGKQPTSQTLGTTISRKETETSMSSRAFRHARPKHKADGDVVLLVFTGARSATLMVYLQEPQSLVTEAQLPTLVTKRAPVGARRMTSPSALCLGQHEWPETHDNIKSVNRTACSGSYRRSGRKQKKCAEWSPE